MPAMDNESSNITKTLSNLKIPILILIIFFAGLIIGVMVATKTSTFIQPEAKKEMALSETNEFKSVFSSLNDQEKNAAENIIREQIRTIITRPQFFSSMGVVNSHKDKIKETAQNYQIPPDVTIGMAALENGGSESAVSSAGAVGIFQITRGTAQQLGLTTDGDNDERLDPDKNISAGIKYLDQNLKLFSDVGLAVWSYHAGPQNVSVAIKTYLQTLGEKDAYDYVEAEDAGILERAKYVWRAYITKGDINVHRLLQNPRVQLEALAGLTDETELYIYKVVAAAIVWNSQENYPTNEAFRENIAKYNQGKILLSELLNPGEN